MADVLDKVRSIIVDIIAVPPAEVVPEASLVEDLGMDSQDFLSIILAIEEEYSDDDRKIELSDDDIGDITTVGGIVALLEQKGIGQA